MPTRLPRRAFWAVVLALSICAPRPAAALDQDWGFRAGWSAARLQGSFGDQVGGHLLSNVATAFYVRVPLGSRFGFQPEICFSGKGGQGDVELVVTSPGAPPTTYGLHLEHRLPYLEVPLLVRLDFRPGGIAQPYLVLGPAPAWRLGEPRTHVEPLPPPSSARAARTAALIYEDVGTLDGDLRIRSFDLGAVGGFGVWFGKGSTRVGLEARYVRGLLDVHPSAHTDVRNEMFMIATAIEVR